MTFSLFSEDDDIKAALDTLDSSDACHFDFKKVLIEIDRINRKRALHDLASVEGRSGFLTKLSEVSMLDQSMRSILSKEKVNAIRVRNEVQLVLLAAETHVLATYYVQLHDAGLTTEKAKRASIKDYFKTDWDKVERLNSVIEQIDVVLKDIDQAHFAMQLAQNSLSLTIKFADML